MNDYEDEDDRPPTAIQLAIAELKDRDDKARAAMKRIMAQFRAVVRDLDDVVERATKAEAERDIAIARGKRLELAIRRTLAIIDSDSPNLGDDPSLVAYLHESLETP